jgi:hypothetical protein
MQKFCPGAERGKAIRACLQTNAAQLSEECKAAAAESSGRRRKGEVRKVEGGPTE